MHFYIITEIEEVILAKFLRYVLRHFSLETASLLLLLKNREGPTN